MSRFLSGKKIDPRPIDASISVADMVDTAFDAYNAARLREACHLFARKMLDDDVTVGLSLTGALTPAGLGISCLVPLIENGFVDWIVSTGANLYHDIHFAIGETLHRGDPQISDVTLRDQNVIRIYDVFFDYEVLLSTDRFLREILKAKDFQREMGTAEFHYLAGRYLAEREEVLSGRSDRSLLACAFRHQVPVFTSSPGDSSIGMNVAAARLDGCRLRLDPSIDVNQTAAIVLEAKRGRPQGKSAVLILGGGSPKNFVLQTEPHIQEVLGIRERGHDFFLQVTDARPDTGGASGATPSEAVSWGKVDPERLPDAVVCYLDSTVALPILTAYALARRSARHPKRLYSRLDEMVSRLVDEYERAKSRKPQDRTSHRQP